MYGLINVLRDFFYKLQAYLVKNRYTLSATELCLFRKEKDEGVMYGFFYVDDIYMIMEEKLL